MSDGEHRPAAGTATKANALTADELGAFMSATHPMTLTTERTDGYAHVTPLWYLWREGRLYFTLVEGRRHLRNLRRTPRATICVSEDDRPQLGAAGRARAAMFAGPVELIGPVVVTDPASEIAQVLRTIATRYLGSDAEAALERAIGPDSGLRTMVILTPEVTMTFDLSKR